jgi:indolepyruvate ferredoxin oxidoreductase alpha subunit
VNFIKTADPYDLPAFIDILKEANAYCKENGPAVVIAEHPCLLNLDRAELNASFKKVIVNRDVCDGCGYCVSQFECPALNMDQEIEQVCIDPGLCTGCAVCSFVCPKGALVLENQE